jgi:predicted glycogen debranching enzyme
MIVNQNNTAQELGSKEWIITNGLGSYASASITGMNTRRYHGLLVHAFNPPTERKVIVSKIDEQLLLGQDFHFSLSTNQYPGTIYPEGFKNFKFFERKPLPTMKFEAFDHHLLKSVFMVKHSNTTIVEYENTGETTYKLRLTPLWVFRDYHSMFHENDATNFWLERTSDYFTIYPHYGSAPVFFSCSHGEWFEHREWYKDVEYAREIERGLDSREDVYSIFHIDIVLNPGQKAHLMFSTEEEMMKTDPAKLKADLLKSTDPYQNGFLKDLQAVAEQFVVKRKSTNSYSLIAGYHWFTDWGRDTMIAMRGITIASGNEPASKSILKTFFQYVDQGMLPNRFPDNGEMLEYNTIDATLWLFVSLYEYYLTFGDKTFIKECLPVLDSIIQWHIKGTRYNIHIDEETGFVYGGTEGVQLTWMDAKVNDYVVTPRIGYPVEIQALWFNALNIYKTLLNEVKDHSFTYQPYLDKIKNNFSAYYWNDKEGFLYDFLDWHKKPNTDLRPNQIYAASLPFSLVNDSQAKRMIEIVKDQLYTPYGLRTLNKNHADFKGIYQGNQYQRDTAYHQGTVWPFLLNEYFTVLINLFGNDPETIQQIEESLSPLKEHFYKHECIHGISEIFDGDQPKEGKGTINQAWSVGALIQILTKIETDKKLTRKRNVNNKQKETNTH